MLSQLNNNLKQQQILYVSRVKKNYCNNFIFNVKFNIILNPAKIEPEKDKFLNCSGLTRLLIENPSSVSNTTDSLASSPIKNLEWNIKRFNNMTIIIICDLSVVYKHRE